jgi:hypothetical protein
MGLAPSRNGENPGKSAVAKVPVPILSQPRNMPALKGNAVKDFRSRIRENSEVLGRLRILTNSATFVFPVSSTPGDPSRRSPKGPRRALQPDEPQLSQDAAGPDGQFFAGVLRGVVRVRPPSWETVWARARRRTRDAAGPPARRRPGPCGRRLRERSESLRKIRCRPTAYAAVLRPPQYAYSGSAFERSGERHGASRRCWPETGG